MCGFAGIFGVDILSHKEKIKKCLLDMEHRGPDFSHLEISSNYIIGHNRLSIRDLSSKGNQPKFSGNKNFLIAFNGEIYNTDELILKYKLTTYDKESDTSILLKLFEKIGVKSTLNIIDGMFSISVLDLEQNIIYLSRDSFGIKPLFYFFNDEFLLFSSEVKPLARHFGYTLRNKSISSYLDFGYVRGSRTLFNEYIKVEPGQILILKLSDIKNKKIDKENIILNRKDSSLINSIKKSVNDMLISDVNLGIFLSGGIDSSLIASLIKNKINNLISHTVKFNVNKFDESFIAKETANSLSLDHIEHTLDENVITDSIENIGNLLDEPISDSSFLATFFISKMSRKYSTVVLSGDGADELFGGYKRYIKAKKNWFYLKFLKFLFPIKIIRYLIYEFIFYLYKLKFKHTSKNNFIKKLYSLDKSKCPNEFYKNFTKKMFISSEIFENYENISEEYDFNSKSTNLIHDFSEQDFLEYLPNNILVKLDQSTMRNSQEGRVPFLDQKILFNRNQLFLKNKQSFYLHKKALKEYLKIQIPNYPITRKKTGFTVPLDIWMRGELRKIFENEIFSLPTQFNKLELKKLWDDHLAQNNISNKDIIYSLFVLNKYLKSI